MNSLIYVPASDDRKITKAFTIPNCGVILDLEDSIIASEKTRARENAAYFTKHRLNRDQVVYVRINDVSSSLWQLDVQALVAAKPDALIIPKAETVDKIQELDTYISEVERNTGLEVGSTKFHLIFETALGIIYMKDVLKSSKRILSASIGMADLCKDLGINWQNAIKGETVLFIAERTQLALVSRAYKLEPPWDSVYLQIDDQAGLRKDTEIGARLGCQGKHIIHPSQREVVDLVYKPNDAEYLQAKQIIASYEEAKRFGKGAILKNGMMIDEPIVAHARTVIEHFEKNVEKR